MWYHFEKAPDNYTYLDNLKRQDDRTRKLGGLLEALYIAEDTLKNQNATKVDKENADLEVRIQGKGISEQEAKAKQ